MWKCWPSAKRNPGLAIGGESTHKAARQGTSAADSDGLPAEALTALALEPRLLLDAAAAATGAEAAQQDDGGDGASADGGGTSAPETDDGSPKGDDAAARALAERGEDGGGNEIVFVDTSVADWRTLVDGVDPSAEVVQIDKGDNGIAKMADTLRERSEVDAVHVVSHGYAGGLYLGGEAVTASDLDASAADLRVIGDALAKHGDILFYGCNVAEGEAGAAFVGRLSALTGADIAASTDMTGTDNWDFEHSTGAVESDVAFSTTARAAFSGSLATIVVDSTADTIASDGVTTFREAIQQADGTAADDTIVFDSGIAGQTINLSNDVTDRNLSNFFDNGSLTIDGDADGDGQGDITIDGGGNQGLIFTADGESLNIQNITLTNFQDQSSSSLGGAIHVEDLSVGSTPITVNITGSNISDSTGDQSGAVRIDNGASAGDVTFTDTTFSNNTATNTGEGGAFRVTGVGAVTIDGVSASGNTASGDGGAGYIIDYTSLSIVDSSFVNNSSPVQGGGLYIEGSSNGTISNSLFAKNTVSSSDSGTIGGGGLLLGGSGTTTLENITVADNTVTNSGSGSAVGGGIAITGQTVTLENTLVTGNQSNGSDSSVFGSFTNANSSSLVGATVNFVDPASNDYRLDSSDANAIDQGDNTLADASFDIRGVDRVRQGEVDIGAYESPYDFVGPGTSPGTAPDADLNGADGAGNDFATTFAPGGVNIADSDAELIQGDSDTTLTRLTVTIPNVQDAGQETLSLTAAQVQTAQQAGISVSGNNTTTLTLSGGAALADYQTALRQIVYDNTAGSPTGSSRDVTVQADDDLAGTTRTTTVSFEAPPIADLNGGDSGQDFTTTFNEATDQGVTAADGIFIADNPTISDPNGDPIQQIVVTLDNSQGDTGEQIDLSGSFTNVNVTLDSATQITITNAGGATAAQMASALAAVRYKNNDDQPTTTNRTITTQVSDGGLSSTSTTTVSVEDAPDITNILVANGTYGIGDDIDVNVDFDSNITVDTSGGTPTVDIEIDGNTRQAAFDSASGDTATFRYTVADGDTDATKDDDGVVVPGGAISLNGGTITDTGSDPADLSNFRTNDFGETVDAHIVPPSVTTPIAGDGVVSGGEAGSVSVSVTGAESNATVDLSITSSGGGGPVTASGTADGSGNITFSGLDLSSLGDGTLTVEAVQTDAVGNVSTAATAMPVLDTTGPSVATPDLTAGSDTGTSSSDDITADTTPAVDFSASDALTGVPDGTTITVDLDLNNDGDFADAGETGAASGTLTGGAATIQLPALADGTVRVRARVDDAAGNEGTGAALSIEVDTTDPGLSGPLSVFETATAGDGAGSVNATDAHGVTFALTDDAGGRFQIDANTGAVTVASGASFDTESEPTVPITVQGTDAAGNSATQTLDVAIDNVNEAPSIGGVAGETSGVVAGAGSQPVSGLADATVGDVDSADFQGGTLTITQTAGTANGSWGLDGTSATSGADATIAAGETVAVGGTAIGTVDALNDGQGGSDLVLNLGAGATPARVQTLLRSMTYSAPSGLGMRDFDLTLVDNDGTANGGDADTTEAFTVDVTPNPPALSGLDGESRTYSEGAAPVLLDSDGNAGVTDPDSADFDGGALTVSVTGGGVSGEDVLSIVDNGPISVTAGEVFFDPGGGAVKIGDVAGGTGGSDLVVTLNAGARPGDGSVDALLGAIAYSNSDTGAPTAGQRTIEVTLSDAAPGFDPATSTPSTATVDVVGVNDAPTLAGGPVDLGTTDENTATGGTAVSTILGGLTTGDVDDGAQSGIAVVATTGNGSWQVSDDGGASWSDIGAVSDSSARLVDAASLVRYVPDGRNGEAASLDFRAWDQTNGTPGGTADTSTNGGTTAFSSGTARVDLTVTDVNDAPSIAGGPADLGTTEEDNTSSGTAVSAILAGASASDVDSGAASGIAVVGTSGNGTWEVSTDGGASWSALGTVSDGAARLLDASAQVRYVPDGANGETASLQFRAWDQTSGTPGGIADTSTNGGTTAFSATTAQAQLTVDPVNDAPTTTGVTTLNIAEDGVAVLYAGDFNFADIDNGDGLDGVRLDTAPSQGTLFVDADGDGRVGGGEAVAAGQVVSRADIDAGRLKYRPDANVNGADSLTYSVRDRSGAFAASPTRLDIQVAPVNDAPTAESTLPDRTATIGEPLSFELPSGLFADVDAGDTLTLSASLADGGSLPAWLSFDPATRTFSGEPGDGDSGSFTVGVTATDEAGATGSASFGVTVESGTTSPPAIAVLNRGPVRVALVETDEGSAPVAFSERVSGQGLQAVLSSLERGNSPLSRSFAESVDDSGGNARRVIEAAASDPRTLQALQTLDAAADEALIYEDGAWVPLDLETLLDFDTGQTPEAASAQDAEAGPLTGRAGDRPAEAEPAIADARARTRADWIDRAAEALVNADTTAPASEAGALEANGFSWQLAQRATNFDRDAAALAAALAGEPADDRRMSAQ